MKIVPEPVKSRPHFLIQRLLKSDIRTKKNRKNLWFKINLFVTLLNSAALFILLTNSWDKVLMFVDKIIKAL